MSQPIADYALLGDCQGAALVGRDGSVDWWCAPRFDSRSVFARLLDPGAGHWTIRPVGESDVEREYVADTLVLRTTFRTAQGVVRLTDALVLGESERGHDLGLRSPHALVRLVEGLAGEVSVDVDFSPRPEYGLVTPRIVQADGALATFGGADVLVLSGDAELEPDRGAARAELVLREGDSVAFAAEHREALPGTPAPQLDPRRALEDTVAAWQSWSELHQAYEGFARDEVRLSARVLQALTYQPTGAVVAAATTSLPEIVGGSWNWDYRFAWLRDASMTLNALWVGACPDEAGRYFQWMARAAAGARERGHVQIMFGVGGERDLTEHELGHLSGYRYSRPVRVGNDAWRQTQLDVYGEVLDAAYGLRDVIGGFDALTARFLCTLADQAAERWQETDAGIWEGREGQRHYLSAKLMCWVALDRAVKLAAELDAEGRERRWASERDAVREAILGDGWSDEAGAYTGAFGSDHLDASVLMMPLVGFLPAGEQRMRATIAAIEEELSDGGLVRRWTGAEEGGFVICSYWLADCLARAGEVERATEVFEAVSGCASDLGLLSEEIDPQSGELIGNFPQAFSHVGLINAAWSIEQAAQRRGGDDGQDSAA
jgi:GH15 family glucan-1,4-alpha-glucosidase